VALLRGSVVGLWMGMWSNTLVGTISTLALALLASPFLTAWLRRSRRRTPLADGTE
jgi:hypothetical protein